MPVELPLGSFAVLGDDTFILSGYGVAVSCAPRFTKVVAEWSQRACVHDGPETERPVCKKNPDHKTARRKMFLAKKCHKGSKPEKAFLPTKNRFVQRGHRPEKILTTKRPVFVPYCKTAGFCMAPVQGKVKLGRLCVRGRKYPKKNLTTKRPVFVPNAKRFVVSVL